jgi:hypothetical protein
MTKKDRIAYVKAGLQAYARLNESSRARTTKAAWIAFKLGCDENEAAKYVSEAEAAP